MSIFGAGGHFWKVRTLLEGGLRLEFSLSLGVRQYSLFVSVLTSIEVLLLVHVCVCVCVCEVLM